MAQRGAGRVTRARGAWACSNVVGSMRARFAEFACSVVEAGGGALVVHWRVLPALGAAYTSRHPKGRQHQRPLHAAAELGNCGRCSTSYKDLVDAHLRPEIHHPIMDLSV